MLPSSLCATPPAILKFYIICILSKVCSAEFTRIDGLEAHQLNLDHDHPIDFVPNKIELPIISYYMRTLPCIMRLVETADKFHVNRGCFSLLQTDRSQISGNTRRKWHFPIKVGLPIGVAQTIFSFLFPNSLIWTKNRFVNARWNGEFWSEYSDRNKWTTSIRAPEYSGRKKSKQTFPFHFRPKFQESLA